MVAQCCRDYSCFLSDTLSGMCIACGLPRSLSLCLPLMLQAWGYDNWFTNLVCCK
jgi:hypothetical protein